MYLKVHDKVSKIDRQVTQKAYDIITKNKKNPRYQFLEYVDEKGNRLDEQPIIQSVAEPQKKTEPKSAEPAVDNLLEGNAMPESNGEATVKEGITIIRKKPGPKPKQNA